MRKLLANKRKLSPIGALAAIAVVCLCLGSVLLTVDYRGQVNRSVAAGYKTQKASYAACLLRNVQTARAQELERADAVEQESLVKIERDNVTLPRAIRRDLITVFRDKMIADLRFVAAKPVDCSRLNPQTVTSSSRGR